MSEENKTDNMLLNIREDGQIIIPKDRHNNTHLKFVSKDGVEYIPMLRSYQNYIDFPPKDPEQLYKDSCSNDEITIKSWKKVWIEYAQINREKYNFNELSVLQEQNKELSKPVIIAGSGPSLKRNAHLLNKHAYSVQIDAKGTREIIEKCGRKNIKIVSCLHNFGFFEDMGIMTPDDYYLNLDSGDITIPELYEGGTKDKEEYLNRTKDRTLIATVTSNPKLLELWRGKILFFHVPQSEPDIITAHKALYNIWEVPGMSTGGNALGACLYFARAVLGAGPIIFVGADFCFDYTHKFHSWNSPYDKQFSGILPWTDVYGNKVYTWPSYLNFKKWFDFQSMGGAGSNPQFFINSTEGGILGAYPQGNIRSIIQMGLEQSLTLFNLADRHAEVVKGCETNPMVLF